MKVSVIGAGSWGTALSQVLANNGHNVGLWARKPEVVKAINSEHRNPRYLSDVELNPDVVATLSYRDTLLRARAAVIVTPSTLVRGAARLSRRGRLRLSRHRLLEGHRGGQWASPHRYPRRRDG